PDVAPRPRALRLCRPPLRRRLAGRVAGASGAQAADRGGADRAGGGAPPTLLLPPRAAGPGRRHRRAPSRGGGPPDGRARRLRRPPMTGSARANRPPLMDRAPRHSWRYFIECLASGRWAVRARSDDGRTVLRLQREGGWVRDAGADPPATTWARAVEAHEALLQHIEGGAPPA